MRRTLFGRGGGKIASQTILTNFSEQLTIPDTKTIPLVLSKREHCTGLENSS